jgi:hypothetical protein
VTEEPSAPRMDDDGRHTDRPVAGRTRWWVILVAFVIGAAFLALIVYLHLNGVMGPGTH